VEAADELIDLGCLARQHLDRLRCVQRGIAVLVVAQPGRESAQRSR
jgi:hypothetical protein